MDQPPAVAFTAFANVWPRATEMKIGAALCAIGAGRTLTFFYFNLKGGHINILWIYRSLEVELER